jgi:hypothetical protein
MKRASFGITLVAVLSVPMALAADWVTDKEVRLQAEATPATTDGIPSELATHQPADEIRIYPSF